MYINRVDESNLATSQGRQQEMGLEETNYYYYYYYYTPKASRLAKQWRRQEILQCLIICNTRVCMTRLSQFSLLGILTGKICVSFFACLSLLIAQDMRKCKPIRRECLMIKITPNKEKEARSGGDCPLHPSCALKKKRFNHFHCDFPLG